MSKKEIKELTARKRLIKNKLGTIATLTASDAHAGMLQAEIVKIDRRLIELQKQ